MKLDRFQDWMQAIVTWPGAGEHGVEAAVREHADRSGVSFEDLNAFVLPGPRLNGAERVGIYARMIWLRFLESMEEDFQGVRTFLGRDMFRDLVRRYLADRPSSSYTLNHLGAAFADWLLNDATELGERRQTAHELAAVERAIMDVANGPDADRLTVDALLAIPMGRWPETRFRLAPSLELFACRCRVNDYLSAVFRGDEVGAPEAGDSFVCVHRTGSRVQRSELSREGHAVLSAIGRGATLAEALEEALELEGVDPDPVLSTIGDTFRDWTASEIFCA